MPLAFIYTVNILLIALISIACYRRYRNSPIRSHYWPSFGFKILSGVLMGLLFYEYYNGGDTITYYEKARQLSEQNFKHFINSIAEPTVASQQVRAIYFTRLVAVIRWLTGADYWLLTSYFSLFSFLGSTYLVDKLIRWRKALTAPALTAFMYFPSVVFWSSGLLKESLVFGALTFMLGTYISWYNEKRFHVGNFAMAVLAFIIIVSFKYYIAAVLIPIILYLTVYHHQIWKRQGIVKPWMKSGILLLIFALPLILFLSWLSPNLSYSELWRVMQVNHFKYIELAPNGALHTIVWLDNSADLFINVPYLLFSGTFRPLIWENLTFPAICAGLENTFLLIGGLLSVIQCFKKSNHWSVELIVTILYVSTLSLFLAYATPNFGTLARYKIYYTPFLLMLIIFQLQKMKLWKKN